MNVWDVCLNIGENLELPAADGWNTAIVVLHGTVQINDQAIACEARMVLLDREGRRQVMEGRALRRK